MSKPVVFSGIQPTGNLHLGNYLGAIKNIVELQNSGKYQMYYFIADLHSLTGTQTAAERRAQTLVTAAELIAVGIDPQKTCLFVQSAVPQHTELAWFFNCVTPIAELQRMTQFKDKSSRQDKNINAGLLTYPILQAADILLYMGELVPIGKDQAQHLELTNDIVRWFNKKYGEFFKMVKPLFTEVPKVMSLLEPEKKMSKSLGGGHVLELADEPKIVEAKLKRAVTASAGGESAPGAQNLLMLLKQFGEPGVYKQFAIAEKDGTIRYGDLKQALSEATSAHFAAFRARRAELLQNPTELNKILEVNAAVARTTAEQTMAAVRELVGVR